MATLIQTNTKSPSKFSIKRVLFLTLVISVILGLLGAGYWNYLNIQSENPYSTTNTYKLASNSASKSASATNSASRDFKDWTIYNNKRVTFNYPKGWDTGGTGDGTEEGSGMVALFSNYPFKNEGGIKTTSDLDAQEDYKLLTYGTSAYKTQGDDLFDLISRLKVNESTEYRIGITRTTYTRQPDTKLGGFTALKYKGSGEIYLSNGKKISVFSTSVKLKKELPGYMGEFFSLSVQYKSSLDEVTMNEFFKNVVDSFKFL